MFIKKGSILRGINGIVLLIVKYFLKFKCSPQLWLAEVMERVFQSDWYSEHKCGQKIHNIKRHSPNRETL